MASGCCDNPDPRILEKNNRWYCHNCKRYLTKAIQQDEPPEYNPTEDAAEAEKETTT